MELYEHNGEIHKLRVTDAEANELRGILNRYNAVSLGRAALYALKGMLIDPINDRQASIDRSNMHADTSRYALQQSALLYDGKRVFDGAEAKAIYDLYTDHKRAQITKRHRNDPATLQLAIVDLVKGTVRHKVDYGASGASMERVVASVTVSIEEIAAVHIDVGIAQHNVAEAFEAVAGLGLSDIAASIEVAGTHIDETYALTDETLAALTHYQHDILGE